jgi:hypothetical protein
MTAPDGTAADPFDLEAIVDAVADFATIMQEVAVLRARLLAAGDGATPAELEAIDQMLQADFVVWKHETLARLRDWLGASGAPQVH